MVRKKYYWLISILAILLIFAWSPWITKDYVEKRVIEIFEEGQKDVIDGCGFTCMECGVYSKKIFFGYEVSLSYRCGLKDYLLIDKFFVSSFGTVHTLSHQKI